MFNQQLQQQQLQQQLQQQQLQQQQQQILQLQQLLQQSPPQTSLSMPVSRGPPPAVTPATASESPGPPPDLPAQWPHAAKSFAPTAVASGPGNLRAYNVTAPSLAAPSLTPPQMVTPNLQQFFPQATRQSLLGPPPVGVPINPSQLNHPGRNSQKQARTPSSNPNRKDKVSQFSPGRLGTCSVDQCGLELREIHLPLPPECWD
ncbi:CDKN1A-interacting zinc finger protein 1 [Apodemus speciosus]|uniref:CDKN1A-interacting zinc finger protein 1 n=1 Tax=Apodemus speciosus TaxID=105296 RepID=A0ABQ0EHG6_APOSI